MPLSLSKTIFKILRTTVVCIVLIPLLLFLLPILFPGKIAEEVKKFANHRLNGEMNFSKVRLSFFSHFPSLTVSLHDYSIKGSAPFEKDTLLSADEVAFGINLKSLVFDNKIHINKILLDDANIRVLVDEKGGANYNIYVPSGGADSTATDSSSASMRLEEITISNTHLVYEDRSIPLSLTAEGLEYTGDGDFDKAIFALNSSLKVSSLDLVFDNQPYLIKKELDAELITQINTSSLAFLFSKNNVRINKLPVEFKGYFNFLKNGYDLDFTVIAKNVDLEDCITALPPAYEEWNKQTSASGKADMNVTFKGKYIASIDQMPDLTAGFSINKGYIKHEQSAIPLSNLFVNCSAKLPSLNTDSLQVKVDTLSFNLEKDYLVYSFELRGTKQPSVKGKLNALLDLETLDKAVGIPDIDLTGK